MKSSCKHASQKGASMLEYVLLAAIISIACYLAVYGVGLAVERRFNMIGLSIESGDTVNTCGNGGPSCEPPPSM